ncbi:MAG TPA: alpha/beta hydrolase [Jatrophihabitans sp.]|jgi:fermentation-respiration switch protein FrsA (DUF1100 family)|uniref:alpha/beta hydrolase n=1 Tax=Jatrophihabitans sp. TaxID=1932789 RepID=UPI002E029716|nr:alpha/beta hydrolase [Jatrophihabitans sp.]
MARRGAVAAAAVVGVLATAVGGGLAGRHLVKVGLTGPAVLGLILLVTGLGLGIGAAVVSWRAMSRWRRLWFVPVTLVALSVMWSVALGTMYAYSPRTGLGSATPARYGLPYADVSVMTGDGVRLSGWYLPSHNGAAVVVVPGAGSTRTAALPQAAAVARNGYGALLIDPRGQGRSGGRVMDLGWYGDRDIAAAAGLLEHRPDVDPARIGVLGLSMGGEEAIGAAAAVPALRAVVAEGATGRTAGDKSGWLPGGMSGAVQRYLDWMTFGTTRLLSPAPFPPTLHSAIDRASGTSFLLITAGGSPDEARAAAYLESAAPSRVQVWTVPDAGHTGGLVTRPQEWTARVTGFLHSSLT